MTRGLLFDLDGLLIDSERVVQRAWNDVGEQLGYGKLGEHIYNTLGMNVVGRKGYFQNTFGEEFPFDTFRLAARKRFFEIADSEGIALKKGARELLFYAKQFGYQVALVTSSRREYAMQMLERANIDQYFDAYVFGDMVTKSKPDPEIYELGCKLLGFAPEYCVAFEDAPAGIASANAAGLDVIVIPDLVKPEPDLKYHVWRILPSLDEAIGVLRKEMQS